MKKRIQWFIKICAGVSLITATLFLFGQGCGPSFKTALSTGGLSSLGTGTCTGNSGAVVDKTIEVLPGRKTASILYGQQLLDNLVSCTGIGSPSQRTLDEWTKRNPSLSEYGNLTDVSGAMMMAVAGVAAEACQDLLEKETVQAAVNRGIFSNINLASTGLTQSEVISTAKLLALSCWQRDVTTEEQTSIVDSILSLNANSKNGALGLCTAMLSSLAMLSQ